MYRGKRVSIVLPAYNEAESITQAVKDFRDIPEVDEVLVVDNNSRDNTAELALAAGARVVKEMTQGYGSALRRGLCEAAGELVATVEPDGTFVARDLLKLLCYADDFDVVFGTRTAKTCIWDGANMGHFLRYGNCAVAKYLEYLHNGPCLTDVGCTFKLLSRAAIERCQDALTVNGSHFSPQLMVAVIRRGVRCVEIPVNYCARVGHSKITGSKRKAFFLGLRMIGLITAMRFRRV
jgi:glycosyltransferase involved in cell wall biosynthesis